ncbi:MAG: Flp pilus assembly complex ATPase component TadA [Oligoflexia bacterium]|nr:Flp pilus assembly complex ATPase component TadA [Oligoflexia bacterium]
MNEFKKYLSRGEILPLELLLNKLDNDSNKNKLIFWYENILNLKFLSSALNNPCISEIIIHDHQNIEVDIAGRLETFKIPDSAMTVTMAMTMTTIMTADEFEMLITALAIKNQQAFNYNNPYCSFNLEIHFDLEKTYKVRATLIHHSITPNNHCKLFLRKIGNQKLNYQAFNLEGEVLTGVLSAITNKKNIIIAGATNSGKTTLLNILLNEIPNNQHLIILEDTHELTLARPNLTHLISNEFHQKKTLKEYCNYALRLRPDRIIVGEVRGEEIIPLMLNLNTGHKGMISSLHANSADEVIKRLALLYALYSDYKEINFNYLEKLIEQNIDVIIYMENRSVRDILYK